MATRKRWEQLALLPHPEPEKLELSEHFGASHFEWNHRTDSISYRKSELKRPCDECSWRMHELRGKGPSSRSVRMRRTLTRVNVKEPIVIYLCHVHGTQWKERDGV